jgi:HEAT repeat protein
MTPAQHRVRFAAAAVFFIMLLATATLHLGRPRYEGRTARDWFLLAVENEWRSQSINPAWESSEQSGPLTAYAQAFRRMGDRGIRLVVSEYLRETPFYLEWYDKSAKALSGVVSLPARKPSTSMSESITARRLLLAIGHPATPELIRRTRSGTAEGRGRAANLLGELGPGNEQAKERLLEMLVDPSVEVVYQSLEVLWMTRPDPATAIPALLPLLTHTNDRVRIEASYAIGTMFPLPGLTVEPLQAALSDASGTVRANAARAIGLAGIRSGPTSAVLDLQLEDTIEVARFRAAEALARLYGREAPNRNAHMLRVVAEAEASPNRYFQLIGLSARTLMGDVEAARGPMIQTCRELLSGSPAYFRVEAIESLCLLMKVCETEPEPEIRSMLIIAQKDLNGYICQLATDVLRSGWANPANTRTLHPDNPVSFSPIDSPTHSCR